MELRNAVWTRPVERAGETSEERIRTEELYRKFRAILNNLTPQKFQSLAEQALKLEINTEERLSGCVDMIYKRVCLWHCSLCLDLLRF